MVERLRSGSLLIVKLAPGEQHRETDFGKLKMEVTGQGPLSQLECRHRVGVGGLGTVTGRGDSCYQAGVGWPLCGVLVPSVVIVF